MKRRVLLVGATGAFGERLARLLAPWPHIELVLAARRLGPLQALAAELGATAVVFDRGAPGDLRRLSPWAVVDAAGPFQAGDLSLPRAAIAAGAHYVDIADARGFVEAFPAALDAEARAAGVLAVTGASSTPALSHAALDRLTRGWRGVEAVRVAIAPGAKAPRGLSVVQAILSYVGRPVRVFRDGGWTTRPGWSGLRRVHVPALGRRWVSLCETPDLDLIPRRFHPRREALFLAGLELAPLHLGLWLLSGLVRLGLMRDLVPLARPLRAVAGVLAGLGSDRGGMLVEAAGEDADGAPRLARWSLAAEANAGPTVPVAAAAAVLRAVLDGRLAARGAQACVGLVDLDAILAELQGLPIRTRLLSLRADEPVLFRKVLGEAFDALPAAVRQVHGAGAGARFQGRGRARGSPHLAPLRALMGLPQPGGYPELSVEVAPGPAGERWTRAFGRHAFASRLGPAAPGQFEERFGALRFTFEAEPRRAGFIWRFTGWKLGPLPLPRAFAPRIRARAFEADGTYRFSVATAHPWLGLMFAYAGRLSPGALGGERGASASGS